MQLYIEHQESYSRSSLLVRSIFGLFFIVFPHTVALAIAGLWGAVLRFISFWVILFTGRYPESMFEYQVGLMNWSLRLNATLLNLVDGYPPFGVSSRPDNVQLVVEYPESIDRGLVLLRVFLGAFYVVLPHGIVLYFRTLLGLVIAFLAFLAVLFSGHYPKGFHNFMVGTLRWQTRISLYMSFMTDEYPPFSSK